MTLSSCGEDDPIIDTTDDGGLLVANGFYPTKVGEDPSANAQLVSQPLDGPDFGTLDRAGFVQAYVFLTAGDYNIVEVSDGEVVATLGGTLTTVEGESTADGDPVDRNSECDADNSSFSLVSAEVDGAAFSVAADGLYVVAYDATSGEISFDQIESAGVIGAATPGGWGSDTEMSGTVNAAGGTWTIEGLALEEGEWKVRFNCRWAIDRRLDATQNFDNANGYSYFTNFGGVGGDPANLAPGNSGSNFNNSDRGEYTVTLTWDPVSGFSASATKTGDLDPLPEFPEAMFLVGAGTAYGWDTPGTKPDAIMHKIAGSNPGVYWKVLSITATTGFKIAAENWGDPNLGANDIVVDTDGIAITADGDGNMTVAEDGIYMVVLDIRESGMNKVSITDAAVYAIGDAFGGFDEDVEANLFTADFASKSLTSPAASADGDLRMYAHHPWIPDWWNAEFVPMNGVIEYRNDGGDQDRVAGTTGQVITLFFDDNTATIE